MDNRRTFFKQLGALLGTAYAAPKALLPDERTIAAELFQRRVPPPPGADVWGHVVIDEVSYPIVQASMTNDFIEVFTRDNLNEGERIITGYTMEATLPGYHEALLRANTEGPQRVTWHFEGGTSGSAHMVGVAMHHPGTPQTIITLKG